MTNKIKFLMLLIIISAIVPQESYAYLDPGTGSMVVQIIVASIAAIGVFLKSFWVQIKSFFVKGKKNDSQN